MHVSELQPNEAAAYLGVYQAYAYQQGYEGTAYTFRIPDDYFEPSAFEVRKFMAVVASFDDEGCIHYWRYYTLDNTTDSRLPPDRFLVLACTEDESMNAIDPSLPGDYHHASHPSWDNIR